MKNKLSINNMKYKGVFFVLIIVLILGGISLYFLIKQHSNNSTKNDDQTDSSIDIKDWKSYSYSVEDLIPGFSLKYPNGWEEAMCDAGGCWDINLSKDSRELLIDLSGQGNSTFQQSLNDWITIWGSYNIQYDSEVIEQDTLTSGNRKYIIYEVTEEGKLPYIIAIVDVGQSQYGRWHLAVKATDINDISYIKAILESIF